MISERQGDILNRIIQEYINSAKPISSQLLEKKHKFGLSCATLRNEMQRLTEKGFLYQPHTSAGRVPTDRGYRFFVDELLDEGMENFEEIFKMSRDIPSITKFLASESSNLALAFLPDEKILWKEGWGEIFQEPEFNQAGYAIKFAKALEDLEKNINDIASDSPSEIHIYIGRENPFSKENDFSVITAGTFAILGPKRMDYNKNIHLIDSVVKWMQKI